MLLLVHNGVDAQWSRYNILLVTIIIILVNVCRENGFHSNVHMVYVKSREKKTVKELP